MPGHDLGRMVTINGIQASLVDGVDHRDPDRCHPPNLLLMGFRQGDHIVTSGGVEIETGQPIDRHSHPVNRLHHLRIDDRRSHGPIVNGGCDTEIGKRSMRPE